MPGGVCAVLDYETDMMAEYVSEMAMRVVIPNATVTGAFRKFVNQILTSTRLPSTTILLGMNYLAKRVNTLKQICAFKPTEGQVWKMLTVALLLGSKFLDDNTFQNRSWSDVSGIPVAELNTMENEWLEQIHWTLYVNLDKSKDYQAWLGSWKEWLECKRQQIQQQHHHAQAAMRERLAPIDTSIRTESVRHHPLAYQGWTPEEIAEQEPIHGNTRYGRSEKMGYRSREGSWQAPYQNTWSQAPLTPPDSGYGTPEYLNSATSLSSRYNDWFNQALATGSYRGYQHTANSYAASRNGSYHHQPYLQHYSHGPMEYRADCSCNSCMSVPKAAPYFHQHQHHGGYGQGVMG
ncbi:cyclin-like protein [Xylariaceae sp. FL0016]|nr:cyclin-like protein [Xylariaceae sp. FL0016]